MRLLLWVVKEESRDPVVWEREDSDCKVEERVEREDRRE